MSYWFCVSQFGNVCPVTYTRRNVQGVKKSRTTVLSFELLRKHLHLVYDEICTMILYIF